MGSSKVTAWLQWAKVASANVPVGKAPLLVNLDESVLKFNYGQNRGQVIDRRNLPPGRKHRKEQVNPAEAKAATTSVGFVCDDHAIQPELPQAIIGNKHKLTIPLMAKLTAAKPKNFHAWREDSSWRKGKIMCRILTLLTTCLAAFKETHQVILVLDCASCHYHSSVLGYATRLGVRLLFVPARLTYLLQLLDSYCFSRLKRKLREMWLSLAIESEPGIVSHEVWLTAAFSFVSSTLCGTKWKPAFKANGLLGEQFISPRILSEVGWSSHPDIPADIPSEQQLQSIFPKRAKVSRNSLLSWHFKAQAKGKAKAKPKAHAKAAAAAPMLV